VVNAGVSWPLAEFSDATAERRPWR